VPWYDDEPVRGGYPDPKLLALSGLERMRAGFKKTMPAPPISHLFGVRPIAAGPASVTFSMPCSDWLQSDAGVYFAGTSALVADGALSGAVLAPLGPGQVCVTSELSFNFLRPVGPWSRQLVCRARTIEVGKTVGLAEGLVEDGQGRLVAHCTTRCFIMSMPFEPLEGDPPEVPEPTYDTPDPYLRPLRPGSVDPDEYDRSTFLEIVAKRISGESPAPFVELFAITEAQGEPGTFSISLKATPWVTSPAGSVFGGVLAFFADLALTGAFSTTLSTSETAATLDLKVQFLRPVWPDGRKLTANARVVHRGRNLAVAQGDIVNEDGKKMVVMTSSAAIRTGGSWGSLVVADEAHNDEAMAAPKGRPAAPNDS
jgi:uncharacterized protein (TIGR00369 family)